MPGPRPAQTSGMLYAVITFVFLFIVATTVAVVYYVKAEDYKTSQAQMQSQLDELANARELRNIGTLVGAKKDRKSRIGTLLDYLDQMVSAVTGQVPEDTSAEMKVEEAIVKLSETLSLLADEEIELGLAGEPNSTVGLLRTAQLLKDQLDDAREIEFATRTQLDELQRRFDGTTQVNLEKEQQFLAHIEALQKEADRVQQSYDDLERIMQQSTDDQIQSLMAKLAKVEENLQDKHKKLLLTEATLNKAEERRSYLQQQIEAIKPRPDIEVKAFKPDGKIISVDNQSRTVYINLGGDDHVYRGLKFTAYNRNVPIPRDGVGKATIEVFDVEKNVSVARIVQSQKKNPIIPDDIIANLIWQPKESNLFVVAGEFDFNGDGLADGDGRTKIKALIEGWGGRISNSITVNTDFLVLGSMPLLPAKPTIEDLEIDPMAMEKYDALAVRRQEYKKIRQDADALDVPVFNLDRFLNFIGH